MTQPPEMRRFTPDAAYDFAEQSEYVESYVLASDHDAFVASLTAQHAAEIAQREARVKRLETALLAIRDLRSSAFREYREDCQDMRRIAERALLNAREGGG